MVMIGADDGDYGDDGDADGDDGDDGDDDGDEDETASKAKQPEERAYADGGNRSHLIIGIPIALNANA
eukprot:11206827-Lingulodinium_polyedra.AAC.1